MRNPVSDLFATVCLSSRLYIAFGRKGSGDENDNAPEQVLDARPYFSGGVDWTRIDPCMNWSGLRSVDWSQWSHTLFKLVHWWVPSYWTNTLDSKRHQRQPTSSVDVITILVTAWRTPARQDQRWTSRLGFLDPRHFPWLLAVVFARHGHSAFLDTITRLDWFTEIPRKEVQNSG